MWEWFWWAFYAHEPIKEMTEHCSPFMCVSITAAVLNVLLITHHAYSNIWQGLQCFAILGFSINLPSYDNVNYKHEIDNPDLFCYNLNRLSYMPVNRPFSYLRNPWFTIWQLFWCSQLILFFQDELQWVVVEVPLQPHCLWLQMSHCHLPLYQELLMKDCCLTDGSSCADCG